MVYTKHIPDCIIVFSSMEQGLPSLHRNINVVVDSEDGEFIANSCLQSQYACKLMYTYYCTSSPCYIEFFMDLGELGDDFNEAPTGRHAYTNVFLYHFITFCMYKYSGFKTVLLLVLQLLLPPHSQYFVPARPLVGMHTLNCISFLYHLITFCIYKYSGFKTVLLLVFQLPPPPPPPPTSSTPYQLGHR